MPTYKRQDGVHFAIHAYRELLTSKKSADLKKQIRSEAKLHGEYVRIFKQPNDTIEAVFSRDPGFLLGETVWNYFGKPDDLIFCEVLPEKQFAIVVIVRAGKVYLDTKIPYNSITDELASLVMGDNHYEIYLFGDVPVSETRQADKFTFDKELVKSFNWLAEPLLPRLPVDESVQLQPLELGLRSQRIGRPSAMPAITLIGVVALAGLWWFYQHQTYKPLQVAVKPVTKPVESPTLAMEQSIESSPAPDRVLDEIGSATEYVFAMPGWHASGVTYDNRAYTITVATDGGSLTGLQQWAQRHQLGFEFTDKGIALTMSSAIPNRQHPVDVLAIKRLVALIIDRLHTVLPDAKVNLAQIQRQGLYYEANLTVPVHQVSPGVLNLVGRELIGLPVKINKAQMTLAGIGLLNGNISLLALGN